jgi:hypothetical protein
MSWATPWIAALARGETVSFCPRGHSMRGRVDDGQRVTVVPLAAEDTIALDDIVLCHVAGRDYLHLVKAMRGHEARTRYLIGNNRGGINGWIPRTGIFGRLLEVEP